MTPGERPGSNLEQFAAEALGLEINAAPNDLLSSLLRKLHDEDFLPDPFEHEAILVLAGRPARSVSLLAEEASRQWEMKLRDEIEMFAARFFDLPIEDRRESFLALLASCSGNEMLRERLLALKPGLPVSRESIATRPPQIRILADSSLQLFVLRPAPRAASRRLLVNKIKEENLPHLRDRVHALKQFRKLEPVAAALVPEFLSQIDRPTRNLPRIAWRMPVLALGDKKDYIRYWWILLLLIGQLSHFLRTSGTKTTSPPPQPPVFATQPDPILSSPLYKKFKEQLRIQLELMKITINDNQFQQVASTLFRQSTSLKFQLSNQPGSDSKTRDSYVSTIFSTAGVSLDEEQTKSIANIFIDAQFRRLAVPKSSSPPGESSPRSPDDSLKKGPRD